MPYTIEQRRRSGVIKITLKGAVDRDQLLRSRHELRPLLGGEDVWNVVIDMRKIDWKMTTMDIFDFAVSIHKPVRTRVALVCRPDDADAHFFESVAHNQGRSLELFTDYAAAMKAVRVV